MMASLDRSASEACTAAKKPIYQETLPALTPCEVVEVAYPVLCLLHRFAFRVIRDSLLRSHTTECRRQFGEGCLVTILQVC